MLLQDKVAVVYGGGGSIGGAAARAFAREGARVFLAGRTQAPLDKVAADIRAAGGTAETALVDALDEEAVGAFAGSVAGRAGGIDVSFNAIGVQDVQKPLLEISVEDFLQPIGVAARTQFLTTRAAVQHMIPRGSGVILMFGGSGPQTAHGLGGFKVALDAMEGIRRQWACEAGPYGVRVVTMVTGGVPESLPGDYPGRDGLEAALREPTLLKRTATLADVGDVAAFVASDRARTMTSATVNISCGAIVDH
ncbi:SDR family NAD(P)-dependent oxidoreductase [Nonomuraea sp. CA-141351]|uniref:SDR family NAD(P)-dependent oxidoreductase n=1 Tax=Nonomuraea sp. CA-141351 TaxID=3239996 RepID=UPI003D8E5B72